jgi:hypothetical protein
VRILLGGDGIEVGLGHGAEVFAGARDSRSRPLVFPLLPCFQLP